MAALSGILQRLHAGQHPAIFKPFDKTSSVDFFRDQLLRPGAMTFIGEVASRPVGYLMAELVPHEETGFTRALTALYIQHLAVDEDFRGRGMGRLLLARAGQEATSLGCDVLQLSCWSFNEAAQAFFSANGFAPYQVRMSRPAL